MILSHDVRLLEVVVDFCWPLDVLFEEVFAVHVELERHQQHLLDQAADQAFVQLLAFCILVHAFEVPEFLFVRQVFLVLCRELVAELLGEVRLHVHLLLLDVDAQVLELPVHFVHLLKRHGIKEALSDLELMALPLALKLLNFGLIILELEASFEIFADLIEERFARDLEKLETCNVVRPLRQ